MPDWLRDEIGGLVLVAIAAWLIVSHADEVRQFAAQVGAWLGIAA